MDNEESVMPGVCECGLHSYYYQARLDEEESRSNKLEEKLIHYRYENDVLASTLKELVESIKAQQEIEDDFYPSPLFSLGLKEATRILSLLDGSAKLYEAKVEELTTEIARLQGMLNDKDTLIALLSEEEQVWIRMGRFHNKEAAENAKYYCQECNHHNHNGKCGEKLEYDICSEKDLCQCLYSTKTDEDGKRID